MSRQLVPVPDLLPCLPTIEGSSALEAADREREFPWIDRPGEEALWAARSGSRAVVATRWSIEVFEAIEGGFARLRSIPLRSGCSGPPVVGGSTIAVLDGSGEFVTLLAPEARPSDALFRRAPSLGEARRVAVPRPFGCRPVDLRPTLSGFVLVYPSGIVELGEDGGTVGAYAFEGYLAGFSFDEGSGLGFARDHDRRIRLYRPGKGFTASSAKGPKELPRPFTYRPDICFPLGEGRYALWMVSSRASMARAVVRVDGESIEALEVETRTFDTSVAAVRECEGRVIVILGDDTYWSARGDMPPGDGGAIAPTGTMESVGVIPSAGGPVFISRWQRMAEAGAGVPPSPPALSGGRIVDADDLRILVETGERSVEILRDGGYLASQMPSVARGLGARLLAAGRMILAFELSGLLVLTDRAFRVLRVLRAENVAAAAASGFTAAWISAGGDLRLCDARETGKAPWTVKLSKRPTALRFSGRMLWVGRAKGADRYALEGLKSGERATPDFTAPLGIAPEAIDVREDAGWIGAAAGNALELRGFDGAGSFAFLGDEAFSDLRLEADGSVLALGASGILRLEVRGGEFAQAARVFVLDDAAIAAESGGGLVDGDIDSVEWARSRLAPKGFIVRGTLAAVPDAERERLGAIGRGIVRV